MPPPSPPPPERQLQPDLPACKKQCGFRVHPDYDVGGGLFCCKKCALAEGHGRKCLGESDGKTNAERCQIILGLMAAERARVDQGGAVEQRPVVGHIEERWNTAAAPSDADDVTADSASVATATVSVAAASTAASTDASTDVPFVMGADLPRPPGMPGMVPPGYNDRTRSFAQKRARVAAIKAMDTEARVAELRARVARLAVPEVASSASGGAPTDLGCVPRRRALCERLQKPVRPSSPS